MGPAGLTDLYVSISWFSPGSRILWLLHRGFRYLDLQNSAPSAMEIAPALRRDRSFALYPFHNVLGDRDQLGALVPHLDFGSRPPFLVVGFGDGVGDLDCVTD